MARTDTSCVHSISAIECDKIDSDVQIPQKCEVVPISEPDSSPVADAAALAAAEAEDAAAAAAAEAKAAALYIEINVRSCPLPLLSQIHACSNSRGNLMQSFICQIKIMLATVPNAPGFRGTGGRGGSRGGK